MAIQATKVKVTGEEALAVLRNKAVRQLLRDLCRNARWLGDPRDGPPRGWADLRVLVRALDEEAASSVIRASCQGAA